MFWERELSLQELIFGTKNIFIKVNHFQIKVQKIFIAIVKLKK